MANDLTADEIRKLLKLEPNATCGYVRVTFISKHAIAPGGLPAPFADGRPLGSALYFMLTPEEPVKLHRIRNDQLYHYYLGDPIEVLMLHDDGSTQHHDRRRPTCAPVTRCSSSSRATRSTPRASSASAAGFSARAPNGRASSPPSVELGNADALAAKYPDVAAEIRSFPVPAA